MDKVSCSRTRHLQLVGIILTTSQSGVRLYHCTHSAPLWSEDYFVLTQADSIHSWVIDELHFFPLLQIYFQRHFVIDTNIILHTSRKKVRSSGSKRLSIKRNVSYTVNKLSTKSSQAELPAYIQILPDPAAESDDFSDIKPKQETSGNEDNKANTVDIKREEDEYDIVEDELKNDIVYHETQNDKLLIQGEAYSNIKIDGRKLSDVNYSDTNLQQTSSVCRENDFDITKTNGLKETDRNYFTDDKSTDLHNANDKNDDYYSNLNENINIALQTMDRTIADFENDTSACNPETTVYSENDSEYDIEETYNHLGSLKCKNDYVSSKLNLGQRQRHRSRSLPAEDLKPQVKIICDNIDMYDHLNKTKLVREPTYYNWQPVRHIRTKSLNSQENTKGIKKGDVDAYSHINLKDNNRKSRIKNDSATDVSSSDMLLNNHSPCSELQKQAAFTIRENDSDTQLHSYFILEPNP